MDIKYVNCVLIVLSAVYVCQGVPAPNSGGLKGYCLVSRDCDRNQCCVSFDRLRGKRDLTPDLKRFVDGKCENLGGFFQSCYVEGGMTHPTPGLYYHKCPCRSGFVCVGTGIRDIPVGELGRCMPRRRYPKGRYDQD